MASVYEGRRENDGRRVAIKAIAPDLAADPEFRERFAREVRAASRLDHRHAVPVIDSRIDAGGGGFLAMPFVEGPNLRERIEAAGSLPVDEALDIIEQVASALDEAHRLGLVHRDVKPANILLDGSGSAQLADFGIVRDASATRVTTTGAWLGTLDYAAPEQIGGSEVDARTDVYALAAVTFHALSGSVPFPRPDQMSAMWAHVHEPRPSLPSDLFAHAAQVSAVIARGMAVDPADRYPSTGDFAAAIAAAARESVTARMSEHSVAPGATSPAAAARRRAPASEAETAVLARRRPRRGRRRAPLRAVVLAGLALLVGAAGYLILDPLGEGEANVASSAAIPASGAGGADPLEDGASTAEDQADSAPAGPPDVIGARLDIGRAELERAGYRASVSGGGAFGVIVEQNWVICEQEGPDGDVVDIRVDRSC